VTQEKDQHFMRQAYQAAIHAVGNSDPNPAVGAVVVSQDGEILARGTTQRAGYAHAERHALQQLTSRDLSAATIYVTLEPCCHHGRTPPCVDAIAEKQLARVVISERDFAAEVMGRSVQLLESKGISVSLLEPENFDKEAWFTTGPFFFARQYNRPRVTLKWAQTSDGALAPSVGPSGPISGAEASFMTAALRNLHKCTLATPGAVKHDAPRLTVRFGQFEQAFAYGGLSSFFSELIAAQVSGASMAQQGEQTQYKMPARAFLAAPQNPIERGEFYARQTSLGGEFHTFAYLSAEWRGDFAGRMKFMLEEINRKGYNSILIEAGPGFSELLLQHDLVDAVAVYRARGKTAHQLWGEPGRRNSFSAALDQGTPAGFELLEQAGFSEDDFYFFRRVR